MSFIKVIGLIFVALAANASAKVPWRFEEFPIISFWGPPGTAKLEDFQAYKDAGFTLHGSNPDVGYPQAIAHLRKVGLHSITYLAPIIHLLPPLEGFVPAENDPVIVGYLTGDEPQSGEAMDTSLATVKQRMAADPTRWTFFNMLPPNLQGAPGTAAYIAQGARNGLPVASFDDYVILDDGSELTDQFYRNLTTVRAAALNADIPFWAFAVSIRHRGYMGTYRRPSESDLRWMQYSNLAYGAKGLWYFTYWGIDYADFDLTAVVTHEGVKTDLYYQVQALNRAILAMGKTLLTLKSVDVVHTHPPAGQKAFVPNTAWISQIEAKDALIGFFQDPAGTSYALVVNKQHGKDKSAVSTADKITLRLKGVSKLEAVSWLDGTPGPVPLSEGNATLNVNGGTGVLLKVVGP